MAGPRPAKPGGKLYRKIIVIGGLLLAVNVIVFAGLNQKANTEGVLPTAIEASGLQPAPGDVVSPQTTIGVNLRNDLTGFLEFDGVQIPLDQLYVQPTEGIIQFTPAPGKDLTHLPQGKHTVTVVYWPRGQKQSNGSSSYTWSFTVGA
jgi:hypothetical protein